MAREIAISFALNASLTGGYKAAFQGAAGQVRMVTQAIRQMEGTPVGKLGAAMATQREKIKGLSGSLREAQSTLTALQTRATAAGGASGLLARQIEQAQKRVDGLSGALNRQLAGWKASTAQAATLGGSVRGLGVEYEKLAGKIEQARKAQAALAANMSRADALRAERADLHGRLLGTAMTAATVAMPVKLAISAEDTFADLRKVMDAPESVMQQVFADAQEMSNRTGKSFEDVVTIMTAAAQAGLGKAREELVGVADQAVKMSIAWGVSAEQAGKSLATWQSSMGLTSEQARHTADVINALSNEMNAEAGEIDQIFTRLGPLMKGTGFATQSIAALATAFKSAGAEVEVSGTAMKNFVKVMAAGSAGLTKEKAGIYSYLQIDPNKLQKMLYDDAEGAIMMALEALEKVRPEERNSIASKLFGDESIAAIAPLMTNIDLLRKSFKIANGEVSGSVQQEYANRMKTTATAISQLTQSTRNLGITMGNAVLPVVGAVARGLTGVVNFVNDLAERFPRLTAVVMTGVAVLASLAVGGLGVALVMNIVRTSTNAWRSVLLRLATSQIGAIAGSTALGTAGTAAGAGMTAAGAGARVFAIGLRSILVASGVGAILVAVSYGIMALIDNWDAVTSAMSTAWAWVTDTWGRLGVFFSELGKNLAAIFPGVMSFITSVFVFGRDFIVGIWQGITVFFSGLWQGITGIFGTAWQGISGLASWAFEGVTAVWSGITGFFSGIVNGITAVFSGLFSWLRENFAWIFDTISAVGSTIGKITGAVSNAWNAAFGDDEDEKKSAAKTATDVQDKPLASTAQAAQEKPASSNAQAAQQKPAAPNTLPEKPVMATSPKPEAPEQFKQSYADFLESQEKAKGGKRGGVGSGGGSARSSSAGPVTVVTLAGDNNAPQTLFIPASSRMPETMPAARAAQDAPLAVTVQATQDQPASAAIQAAEQQLVPQPPSLAEGLGTGLRRSLGRVLGQTMPRMFPTVETERAPALGTAAESPLTVAMPTLEQEGSQDTPLAVTVQATQDQPAATASPLTVAMPTLGQRPVPAERQSSLWQNVTTSLSQSIGQPFAAVGRFLAGESRQQPALVTAGDKPSPLRAALPTSQPALPKTPSLLPQSRRERDRQAGPANISIDLTQNFDLISDDPRAVRKILESLKPDMEALVRRALARMQSDRRRTAYAQ